MEDEDEKNEISADDEDDEDEDATELFSSLANLRENNALRAGNNYFSFHVSHWRLKNFDRFFKLTSFYLPPGVNYSRAIIKWVHDYGAFYAFDKEAVCPVCHQNGVVFSNIFFCLNEQCHRFKGNNHFIYFKVYPEEKLDEYKNAWHKEIEEKQNKIIKAIEDFFCNLSNWEPKLVYVIFNYLMLNDFKNNIFF